VGIRSARWLSFQNSTGRDLAGVLEPFYDGRFVLELSASADQGVLLLAKRLRQRLSALSSSGTLRELQATLEAIRIVEAEAARDRAPTLRRAMRPSED
jgi:hypothetical protein